MKTAAYEARVENGTIRLLEPAALPEHTRVIVVVPEPASDILRKEFPPGEPAQILSPRLTSPNLRRDWRNTSWQNRGDDGVPAIRFCGKIVQGRYILIDREVGILGRDVLNFFRLVFDGPALAWGEFPDFPVNPP